MEKKVHGRPLVTQEASGQLLIPFVVFPYFHIVGLSEWLVLYFQGQNQSGAGGGAGDKPAKEDKDKKRKYEPPIPTRVGKKRKKTSKGPETATKLPTVSIY